MNVNLIGLWARIFTSHTIIAHVRLHSFEDMRYYFRALYWTAPTFPVIYQPCLTTWAYSAATLLIRELSVYLFRHRRPKSMKHVFHRVFVTICCIVSYRTPLYIDYKTLMRSSFVEPASNTSVLPEITSI